LLILTFSTVAALSILCLTVITGNYYIQKGTPDFLSEQYIIVKVSQVQQSDKTVVRTGDLINYLNSEGEGPFIVYRDFPVSGGKAIYMVGQIYFKPEIVEGRSFTPEDFKNGTRTVIIDENLSDKCIKRNGKEYFLHDNNEYQVIGKFKPGSNQYVEQDKYNALYFVNMAASFDTNIDSILNGDYSFDAKDKSVDLVNDFIAVAKQINPTMTIDTREAISNDALKNLEQAFSESLQIIIAYILTAFLVMLNISNTTFYWIGGRRKEISTRMLSGGKPSNIRNMILRDYIFLVTIGYGIGIIISIIVINLEIFSFIGGSIYPASAISGYIVCLAIGLVLGFIFLNKILKQNIILQMRGSK